MSRATPQWEHRRLMPTSLTEQLICLEKFGALKMLSVGALRRLLEERPQLIDEIVASVAHLRALQVIKKRTGQQASVDVPALAGPRHHTPPSRSFDPKRS